eukprot:COSAG03_NODE_1377_length_4212_cov_82.121080_3_plen_115_part_00
MPLGAADRGVTWWPSDPPVKGHTMQKQDHVFVPFAFEVDPDGDGDDLLLGLLGFATAQATHNRLFVPASKGWSVTVTAQDLTPMVPFLTSPVASRLRSMGEQWHGPRLLTRVRS